VDGALASATAAVRSRAPWPARVVVFVLLAQELFHITTAYRSLDNILVVDAARRLAHGVSPYESVRFLYPPSSLPFALALTPLSDHQLIVLAPWALAGLLLLGWWAALRMFEVPFFSWLGVLGVGAFSLFAPAITLVQLGNWTAAVVPLMSLALLLMSRERWLAAAIAIGLSIAIKPMLVPMGLIFLLARQWGALAMAAGVPLAISAAVLPFLPRPGLFFTRTVPFLLHGQDNFARPYDSSLPAILPRIGVDGPAVPVIRGLILLLTIAVAVLLWRRGEEQPAAVPGVTEGGDQRLRLVHTSAALMLGTFLVFTPTFGYYPMLLVPVLVASVVVPGSVARSVWYWIGSVPQVIGFHFYRLDYRGPRPSSHEQAFKPVVWIGMVGLLLLIKAWPRRGRPEGSGLSQPTRPC
jgi:arabinofuranan 3-O-arabinosyltransferase